MSNWQELQNRIEEWKAKELKGVTLDGTLEHLLEEVGDLIENPYDPLALADVFILLMGVCSEVGFSMEEMEAAVSSKQAINESRDWLESDEFGVIRHIKNDE